jgi:4,5-dihydroxyphthalate decarboxylase
MPTRSLSLAFWDYDRTRALVNGQVGINDYDLHCEILRPEAAFAKAFTTAEFDITEISLANSATAISNGDFPYRLIPVFLSRAFRLDTIYVRQDYPTNDPASLSGTRIGLQEYDMTAAVVLRGILRDQFGVDACSVRWAVGEIGRLRPVEIPEGCRKDGIEIEILDESASLQSRLEYGEIDVLVSLNPPSDFLAGKPWIRRLIPNPSDLERDYLSAGGIFPIMHAVGIRKSLLRSDPTLAHSTFDAFLMAKNLALAELEITQALKITLPWLQDGLAQAKQIFGSDIWPYGLTANRKTLETQLRWLDEDGLLARPMEIDDLILALEGSTEATGDMQ